MSRYIRRHDSDSVVRVVLCCVHIHIYQYCVYVSVFSFLFLFFPLSICLFYFFFPSPSVFLLCVGTHGERWAMATTVLSVQKMQHHARWNEMIRYLRLHPTTEPRSGQ